MFLEMAADRDVRFLSWQLIGMASSTHVCSSDVRF